MPRFTSRYDEELASSFQYLILVSKHYPNLFSKNAFFHAMLFFMIFDRRYNAMAPAKHKNRQNTKENFAIGLKYRACHYSPLTGIISRCIDFCLQRVRQKYENLFS